MSEIDDDDVYLAVVSYCCFITSLKTLSLSLEFFLLLFTAMMMFVL